MKKFLKNLLVPPIFKDDEEKTWRAELLVSRHLTVKKYFNRQDAEFLEKKQEKQRVHQLKRAQQG